MHIVFKENLNGDDFEIQDWGEWHRIIIAIETLKPVTETPSSIDVLNELFARKEFIDLPLELKRAEDYNAFQELLKKVFIIIKHDKFTLRISVFNKIWKRKKLVGGMLKILARHSSEYNKYIDTDASLFENEFIVPDITAKLLSCRINGTQEKDRENICYTHDNFKLITIIIPSLEIENVISFYPTSLTQLI